MASSDSTTHASSDLDRHAGDPEPRELLRLLDRAIDARIDARLAAVAERLGTVVAAEVMTMLARRRTWDSGDEILLTVPAAAKRLSLSRTTVYQLLKRGELASVKIGGAARIPADALEAFRDALTDGRPPTGPIAGRHTRDVASGALSGFELAPVQERAGNEAAPPAAVHQG